MICVHADGRIETETEIADRVEKTNPELAKILREIAAERQLDDEEHDIDGNELMRQVFSRCVKPGSPQIPEQLKLPLRKPK